MGRRVLWRLEDAAFFAKNVKQTGLQGKWRQSLHGGALQAAAPEWKFRNSARLMRCYA